jgi:acyl carrier protein/NAD(P)-dependent dehydrogenase (short-subunit alcohol dehydrogenase family)
MLELGMDIEADLGIDSIKRVEILGAMRDRFPGLPQLKPEELAELRTLGEIVDYMGDHTGSSNGVVSNGATNGAANGHTAPKVSTPAGKTLPKMEHDIPRHAAELKYLPAPDALDVTLPEGHVAVVTDNGSGLAGDVARELTGRGWRVVALGLNSKAADLPQGVARVVPPSGDDAGMKAALDTIAAEHGPVGAFVYLDAPANGGNLFSADDEAALKRAFLLARHLKPSLTAAADAGYGAFVTVARLDGAFGTRSGDNGAVSGGLFGLTKSVNLEWPGVYCRALDVAADLPPALAAQHIAAELLDPNRRLAQVGISEAGRVTLVAEPVRADG